MEKIKHLVIDEKTGCVSTTRIWMHIAYAALTWALIKQETLSWELMAAYGAIVAGNYSAGQFMKWRYGNDRKRDVETCSK